MTQTRRFKQSTPFTDKKENRRLVPNHAMHANDKDKGKKEERREKKKDIAIPSSYVTNNRQPALSVNDVKQQVLTNRTAPAGGGNPN